MKIFIVNERLDSECYVISESIEKALNTFNNYHTNRGSQIVVASIRIISPFVLIDNKL